jgi:protein gp37
MTANSKIEWTDHTFNPWIGCQKVGPGCDHCYAESMMADRLKKVRWGPGAERQRTSAANWKLPLDWNAAHEKFFAEHGRRQRVFCASLADVFDNAVPRSWRRDLFDLINATRNLDWLLLTKRIGNVMAMCQHDGLMFDQLPYVWLGASIVNQAEADRDIPKLLAIPARKRFLSMEPLLGPVDITAHVPPPKRPFLVAGSPLCRELPSRVGCTRTGPHYPGEFGCRWSKVDNGGSLPGIDWVIVGGESGPGARPMHPDWALDLRDQCAEADVPFLFKQWGEWTPGVNVDRHSGTVDTALWFADKWVFGRENLASFGGHIDDEPDLYRVGKKAASRLLDGVQHDGFPEA